MNFQATRSSPLRSVQNIQSRMCDACPWVAVFPPAAPSCAPHSSRSGGVSLGSILLSWRPGPAADLRRHTCHLPHTQRCRKTLCAWLRCGRPPGTFSRPSSVPLPRNPLKPGTVPSFQVCSPRLRNSQLLRAVPSTHWSLNRSTVASHVIFYAPLINIICLKIHLFLIYIQGDVMAWWSHFYVVCTTWKPTASSRPSVVIIKVTYFAWKLIWTSTPSDSATKTDTGVWTHQMHVSD